MSFAPPGRLDARHKRSWAVWRGIVALRESPANFGHWRSMDLSNRQLLIGPQDRVVGLRDHSRWLVQFKVCRATALRLIMDRSVFEDHFQTAADQPLRFARQFVEQALPDQLVFRVYPNQSYDGNPRVGDEEVFPEETLADGC